MTLVVTKDGRQVVEPKCPNCQKTLTIFNNSSLTSTYITCPDSILVNPDEPKAATGTLMTKACFPYLIDITVLTSAFAFKTDNTDRSFYIPKKCKKAAHTRTANILISRMVTTFGNAFEKSPAKEKFDVAMDKLEKFWSKYQNLKAAITDASTEEEKIAVELAFNDYCREDWKQNKNVSSAQKQEYSAFKAQQAIQNTKSDAYTGRRKFVKPKIPDDGHDVTMQKQRTNADGIITVCKAEGSNMFGRLTFTCCQFNCTDMTLLGDMPLNKNLVYASCIPYGVKQLPENVTSNPNYVSNCIPYAVIKKYDLTSKLGTLENALALILNSTSSQIDFDNDDDDVVEPKAKKQKVFDSMADMW